MTNFFSPGDIAMVIVGLMSLCGVLYAAWLGVQTKRDTKMINSAVNHVDPGERRLYELACEADIKLGILCSRVSAMETKLDAHISNDRLCPLLPHCEILAEKLVAVT